MTRRTARQRRELAALMRPELPLEILHEHYGLLVATGKAPMPPRTLPPVPDGREIVVERREARKG